MNEIAQNLEVALQAAQTGDDLIAIFEAAILPLGYRYCDIGSFRIEEIPNLKKANRFFLSNYLDDDPWRYLPKDWPIGDVALDEMCTRVAPFDYVAFTKEAKTTPATLVYKALLNLWKIKHAWLVPLNTPGHMQFVTVYELNGDTEQFQSTKWTVHCMAITLMEHAERLLGETQRLPKKTNVQLSTREIECLQAIRQGSSNPQIARDLGISENTVRYHLKNLFRKIGVSNRTEAALFKSK